ncbi:MAG: hypothetical protein KIT49_01570 [Nitrospira sp.]|nr:hypothetical protein [Nitrospira sp.]
MYMVDHSACHRRIDRRGIRCGREDHEPDAGGRSHSAPRGVLEGVVVNSTTAEMAGHDIMHVDPIALE